ncbi:protein TIS11, putative [Perkinsus marinus ATCC 50983]|uniref:Protein TIS11, putative n=1 Tax=Perkinsus marinus (strain ATCC 50983 / TXsc) TaxID=423536 RepID=C5LDE7_PERM5|nr:protein TIS11, putative [Perkinsus marinus ATCC 50983]EER05279.1 protein TIS11, putative [Perkinsus marinus ATCC 50983]|eukprot:XP_002773463.1 protein TIS11, putative [Perkinsus marinus ATCC 50983]
MTVQHSRGQTKLPGVGGFTTTRTSSEYARPVVDGDAFEVNPSNVPTPPSSPESRSSQDEGKLGGRNREVFSKTRMCKFFLRGQCKHGSDCGYAHDWSELRQAPDLRKTKMCQLYRKGQCPNGADCAYAHSRDELRATADVYKTSLCRFWMNGSCNAGSKCRHAHGAHELRTRVPTAAGTDAVLTASTTNRLAEVAAANEDPDLMATAASLAASQKAALGSTMAMNDYLEQANLLEQIAKTLEQLNETTGSSGFTAGDEVTLRLRSYTGGRDMVAALLDDPPVEAPSVTNTLPTVPMPGLDVAAPVFVPRKSISSISNEQLQQLQSIIEEAGYNLPSAAATTPLKGPAASPDSAFAPAVADSRPRGFSGWKPYEPSNVNSRRLSQIATILEAKRRLSSFSLAPPGVMPGQNLPPMPSPNRGPLA